MTTTPAPVSLGTSPTGVGHYDWDDLVGRLNTLLRLKTTPIGMKRFRTVGEMEAIPKIRRPQQVHTTDQIVGQAARLGWTVGITADDLAGPQCSTIVGLTPPTEDWLSGRAMKGVWFETIEDSAAHQGALTCAPFGAHQALAVSPLSAKRLDPPDIVLIYATPGQMILLINGLQWSGYRELQWGCVGESSCADSWGRALATGEPSVSIPCFAERRYGGVSDDEMLMAMPPRFLPTAISGMEALSRNGLRYPIPPYGLQSDARAGLGASYPDRKPAS